MDTPPPIDLRRPHSVAQILTDALEIYQRYPLLFMTLALGVIAPYELAVLAATGLGPLSNATHRSAGVQILLNLLDYAFVGPLISALHVHAVMLIGDGERPRLAQVAVRGLRVLPVAAAAVIVAGLGIALGFLALVIPGVLLALRWSVVAQVAAIENEGWLPSLSRSAALARGNYMHILGLVLLAGVLSFSVLAGGAAIPLGSGAGVASVTVGIAVRTFTASFTALTLAILYFDLRARLEGKPARATAQSEHPGDLEPPA
jgi:hypothetical protein